MELRGRREEEEEEEGGEEEGEGGAELLQSDEGEFEGAPSPVGHGGMEVDAPWPAEEPEGPVALVVHPNPRLGDTKTSRDLTARAQRLTRGIARPRAGRPGVARGDETTLQVKVGAATRSIAGALETSPASLNPPPAPEPSSGNISGLHSLHEVLTAEHLDRTIGISLPPRSACLFRVFPLRCRLIFHRARQEISGSPPQLSAPMCRLTRTGWCW